MPNIIEFTSGRNDLVIGHTYTFYEVRGSTWMNGRILGAIPSYKDTTIYSVEMLSRSAMFLPKDRAFEVYD